MNKTYIKDAEDDCDECGSTLEVHAGATTCSNIHCPAKPYNCNDCGQMLDGGLGGECNNSDCSTNDVIRGVE